MGIYLARIGQVKIVKSDMTVYVEWRWNKWNIIGGNSSRTQAAATRDYQEAGLSFQRTYSIKVKVTNKLDWQIHF